MSGMCEREVYSMVSQLQLEKSFRFMELSPELLSIIEEGQEKLFLKAPNNEADVVICTSSKTFKVRQRNHSNTVLVMKENLELQPAETKELIGFTHLPSVFECELTQPSIDATEVPIYDGINEVIEDKLISIEELRAKSAASEMEFDQVWFDMNGSSLNGKAILLDEEFVGKVLHFLVMSITAADLDFDEISIIEVYNSIKDEAPNFSIDIVETVLKKFSSTHKEPLNIDRTKVSKWYGVQSLKHNCSRKALSSSEFLMKWKSELPPFFECPVDVDMLSGHYVSPTPDRVQYLSKASLPNDINGRLKYLFKLQSSWDLNELIPFIDEFNKKGLKWENFIMKFAKKRKIGKRFIVTQK